MVLRGKRKKSLHLGVVSQLSVRASPKLPKLDVAGSTRSPAIDGHVARVVLIEASADEASGEPAPRFNAGMVYDTNRQKVILFGGEAATLGPGATTIFFDDTWEFDFTTGWQQVAIGKPSPGPLTDHAMAYDPT